MPESTIATSKVLVVEDEQIISLFIRNELEDAGFGVELAATPKEARDRLREGASRFEAAVIDLRLRDELGDSLVREFHRLRPELPIVVETGLTRDGLADGLAEGPRLHALRKPFDGPELVGALAAVGVHPSAAPFDAERRAT